MTEPTQPDTTASKPTSEPAPAGAYTPAVWQPLLEAIPIGAAVLSADGTVLGFNPVFKRLVAKNGLEPGVSLRDAVSPAQLEQCGQILDAVAAGAARQFEWPIATGDGQTLWVLVNLRPLAALDGAVCVTLTDVSSRYELEESLAEHACYLEEKNDEIEQLLFAVSHDLKTPLTCLEGYFTLLIEDLDEDLLARSGIAKTVEGVERSIERVEQMVHDLLELSRIGRIDMGPKNVQVEPIVRDVVESLTPTIQQKEIDVRVNTPLPTVRCNLHRLFQLLENLVGNAVKYIGEPEKPFIEIGWRRKDEGSPIYIRDNGIGIDPADHHRVFQVFQRAATRDAEGTGIGLAICKRIVESFGGKIWLESELGKGSTFLVSLPVV
jgi:signal transduction histidine kinase